MRTTTFAIDVLTPPQDTFIPKILACLDSISEHSVVCISSKVVAISEGRCIAKASANKASLINEEATHLYNPESAVPLGRIHGDIIPFAGIDESNGGGYYVLLPKDPHRSAQHIHETLCAHFGISHLGVLIVDSTLRPLRKGTVGTCIGVAGIAPVTPYVGKADLFGRPLRLTSTNVADSLATTADFLMGQGAEATPVVLLEDLPSSVVFTDEAHTGDLCISPEDDAYHDLFA